MAKWKPLDEMTVLSTRYPRLEAPEKVSGKAKYTADVARKGLLYGAILGSPHPAAKIVRIDAGKAQQLPGVQAVLTDVHPTGTIRFAGEEVAAVAAISPEIARDALELIEVEYETRPFAADIDTAMQDGAPQVFANRSNLRDPNTRGEGDVDAGFAEADVVVEREYRTQVQVHAPLEAHGSVAMWEGDELILYDSTQAVHGVREGIAKFLDMPANKVRVICKHMGAAFGSKLQAGRYSAIAARLAKAADAPVKLMLDRKLEFLSVGNRPDSIQKLALGAKKDGTLVAMRSVTFGTAGIGTRAGLRHPMVYEVKNWHREHRDVFTNAGPARAFRAPGCPQTAFAMEQLMDEMAEKLGMDPLDLRLKNDPNPTRQKEWRLGAEKIDWQRRRKVPGSDPGPVQRGLGLAASVWWPGGRATKAKMTVNSDGSVEIRCGTQDIGTGTRTYIASITAEEIGIPMQRIRPLVGDSDFPYSGASGGSTTSPSVAPAIKNTAEKAKKELMTLAVGFFGVAATDLEWHDGGIRMRRVHSKKLTWNELCSLLETQSLEVHGEWVEGLSSAGVAGCQFAEVAVDTDTGVITVEKIVAVADCGLILNRLTTENQVNGAVLQGISYALFEDRIMDPLTGTMINPNYEDYKILGAMETPEIEVVLFDEAERGVIGIGEPPTVPTSGAIANAVYNATGVRLRSLPMTPDKMLAAREKQEKEG